MTYISPKLAELQGFRTWAISNNVVPAEIDVPCKKISVIYQDYNMSNSQFLYKRLDVSNKNKSDFKVTSFLRYLWSFSTTQFQLSFTWFGSIQALFHDNAVHL